VTKRRLIRTLALVVLALAGLPAAAARQPNIIMITVDALRADCLAAYGLRSGLTPNLDRAGRDAVVFLDASCPIPLTNPSMTTTFTSRPCWKTGATRNGIPMLPGQETLPGILRRQGYTTAAVVASWPLQSTESGLAESFDFYEDRIQTPLSVYPTLEREARWTTTNALRWLQRGVREPFFLWLHYADPHQPHLPPPAIHKYLMANESGRSKVERYYDREVAYADHWIGVLLDDLRCRGLLDNSILIISADHGENLGGKKKFQGHGRRLYAPILHVPLLISGPGLPAGLRISDPVHSLDFAPTILGLLGRQRGAAMEGRDLSGRILRGEAVPPVPMFFESYSVAVMIPGTEKYFRDHSPPVVLALRDGSWKLVYTLKKRTWEMYDLAADPDELKNIYDPASADGRRLTRELADYYALRGRKLP
jgi:arylsulfatase